MKDKRKLLILGNAPLPFENTKKNYAAGIRTWQFVEPLIKFDNGFEAIDVYLIIMRNIYNTIPKNFSLGNVHFKYITEEIALDKNFLSDKNINDEYEAIIGINTYPSYACAKLNTQIPFWADLNGYIMAEAQSRAAIEKSDEVLYLSWLQESTILSKADKISVVSMPQKFAVIGELAVLGRLNNLSNGYDFVEYIPAPVFNPIESPETENFVPPYPLDKKKFNIFWSSGYNTWADVDTLFSALEKIMSKYPDVEYISTGGIIKGHDEKTFEKFLALIEKSKFKDRFKFIGWIPKKAVDYYYINCNLGIVCDKNNYETLIGARNRINDMMHFKMPILTSRLSEISKIVERNGLGRCFEISNSESLFEKLVDAYENRSDSAKYAEKAFQYAMENFIPIKSTTPFRLWLSKEEKKSPDNAKSTPLIPTYGDSKLEQFLLSIKRSGVAVTIKYSVKFFYKKIKKILKILS